MLSLNKLSYIRKEIKNSSINHTKYYESIYSIQKWNKKLNEKIEKYLLNFFDIIFLTHFVPHMGLCLVNMPKQIKTANFICLKRNVKNVKTMKLDFVFFIRA